MYVKKLKKNKKTEEHLAQVGIQQYDSYYAINRGEIFRSRNKSKICYRVAIVLKECILPK